MPGLADVEERDIRARSLRGGQYLGAYLGAGAAAGDDLDVALEGEEFLEAVEHERVIVRNEDPHRHHCTPDESSGIVICRCDPLLVDSSRRSPPSDAIRSRRLTGPRRATVSSDRLKWPKNGNPRPSSDT